MSFRNDILPEKIDEKHRYTSLRKKGLDCFRKGCNFCQNEFPKYVRHSIILFPSKFIITGS